MSDGTKEKPELGAIADDVAALKRDMAALIEHLKSGAGSRTDGAVRAALHEIGAEVERLYDGLTARGGQSGDAIRRQVAEQPIASLLLAFAAGFIGGRLISR